MLKKLVLKQFLRLNKKHLSFYHNHLRGGRDGLIAPADADATRPISRAAAWSSSNSWGMCRRGRSGADPAGGTGFSRRIERPDPLAASGGQRVRLLVLSGRLGQSARQRTIGAAFGYTGLADTLGTVGGDALTTDAVRSVGGNALTTCAVGAIRRDSLRWKHDQHHRRQPASPAG